MRDFDVDNTRFFWQIVFDVSDSKPRLQVTVELWNIRSNSCSGRSVEDLSPVNKSNVSFNGAVATFKGGYLQYELNIKGMVERLLNTVFGEQESGVMIDLLPESESLRGENVSLVADARPDEAGDQSRFPIFFLEQDATGSAFGGVKLVETITGTERGLIWSISGSDYQPRQKTFHVDPTGTGGGWHRIRVRQDITPMQEAKWGLWLHRPKRTRLPSWLSGILTWLFGPTVGYGTEFLVGGVQLGDGVPDAQGGTHRFDTRPVKLFIGGAPAGKGVEAFWGDIAYLSFDPHNSCGSCTFGPVPGEGGGVILITFREKKMTILNTQTSQSNQGDQSGEGGVQPRPQTREAQDDDEDK